MPAVMEINDMKNLLSEDVDVILQVLINSQRGFASFLRRRNYNGKDMEVSMQLIVKACTSGREGAVHRLLNMLYSYEDTFLSNDIFDIITRIIEDDYQINPKHFLDNYMTILEHLLKKLEKLDFVSKVLERLENFVNELYCAHKNIQNIKEKLKSIQEEIKRQGQHYEEPTDDFRSISVFPQAADMTNDNPFLQPNKIDEAYKNVDHYLSVQFRLMREDMVRSFRASIAQIKNSNNNIRFRSSGQRPEVNALFKKIKLSEIPEYCPDGVHYTISFEFGDNVSKKNPFISGSIVCLSCDNFVENFIFATIKQQEIKNKRCIISVIVETGDSDILQGKKYQLIVTNAYFESYRNVLSALQRLNDVNFPLSDYIVKLDSSDSEPAYAGSIFCLHESCNFENSPQNDGGDHTCKMFDVLVKEEWPTEEELKLDTHQVLAFQAALTQKLAIIQGPPGTGKTFLGVKIVKALLENVDSKPIIICCQTNHALDQFLNHILKHTPKVLRAGDQSQDKGMQVRSLRNMGLAIRAYRESRKLHIDLPDEVKDSLEVIKCLIPDIDEWNAPKRHADYLEIALKQLCPVLNYMMVDYLNLTFKYIEPTALTKFLPESMMEAHEMDQNQKLKTVKHFIVTWLDIDSMDDVYKRCDQEWEDLEIDGFSVAKEIDKFDKHGSENIWAIPLNKRYRYLYSWRKHKMGELKASIDEKREEYFRLFHRCRSCPEREMQRINLDRLELAKEADILGLTMTGAAKNKDFLTLLKPNIMIVEEAAETLESNVISSLVPTINQLILIGDHEQLRPLPADDELSKKYNLSVSLFERLVKNNIPHATLTTQHRMRPCISDLLVPHIYKELKCSKSVEAYESIKGMQHDLFFLNHNKLEDEQKGTSISNIYEATFISKLASYFVSIGYESSQITVLAMYSAQIALIQQLLLKDDSDILVTTVDNYQGEENDIILVSLVRSNEFGVIGFLCESNRLCVALSRARKGLYCVGNFTMLARKSNFWLNVVEKLKASGQIGKEFPIQCACHQNKIPVKSAEEFDNILEVGCHETCGYQLPCEHYCKLSCHFYDTNHLSFKCLQPCNKIIQVQRHNKTKERRCKRLCYQPCEDSKSFVKLSCGHQRVTGLDSTTNLSLEKCVVETKKTLICGHVDQVPCSVSVEYHKCRALVLVTLKCGHVKRLPCHQKEVTEKVICSEQKPHFSICGHTVFIPCYMTPTEDVLLTYCKKSCDMLLKCGHPCLNPCNWCYNIKIHSNCSIPCERKLYCGHKCQGYCGSPCLECDLKCELGCDHGMCVNPCNKPCVECKNPCTRKCVHQGCSKLCYEECSVQPCQKPCELKLVCGHSCIGLCGDPCPPLCRVCNRKDLKSANLDNDCFIYLSHSCKHVLEATKLTSWIKNSTTQLPNCFQCGATIIQSCRFKDYIINGKKKFFVAAISRFETLDVITYQFHTFCGMENVPTYHFLNLQKKLDDILMGKPSSSQLSRLPAIMFCLTELYNWRIKSEANDETENRFEILVKWLFNNVETSSYQQLQELKESVILLTKL